MGGLDLGQKTLSAKQGDAFVLPKITSALSRFVKPITASSSRAALGNKNSKSIPLEKDDHSQKDPSSDQDHSETLQKHIREIPEPDLSLIEGGDSMPPLEEPTDPAPIPVGLTKELANDRGPSVSDTFLRIINSFHEGGRATLGRWIGKKAYRENTNARGSTGRFRKGAMFDREAQ